MQLLFFEARNSRSYSTNEGQHGRFSGPMGHAPPAACVSPQTPIESVQLPKTKYKHENTGIQNQLESPFKLINCNTMDFALDMSAAVTV